MSSLWEDWELGPDGTIFLKKIFWETNTMAEPNAQRRPIAFDADMSKLHASMTPRVSGSREM